MKIELRSLKLHKQLSQETNAYTATIWIDGEAAFAASNHGQGGCDEYRQIGAKTEQDVEAWIKANTPDGNLEIVVGDLIEKAEAIKTLKRKLKSNVVTIEDGKVYSYKLGARLRPGTRIVGAEDLEEAAALLMAA